MKVRVATFNVENLMERFDFSGWRNDRRRDRSIALMDVGSEAQFKALEQARVVVHADDTRQMTALALAECRADIVCLQEVENLTALEAFERNYLYRMTGISYPQKVWEQGNDGRGIDVALMARETNANGDPIIIKRVKSHRGGTFKSFGVHTERLNEMGLEAADRVFRRDCLEVDLTVGGQWLTIFVCHFKSMGPFRDGMAGRDYTMPVRLAEATSVRRIIEQKFHGERGKDMRWLVCGDLNDYGERLAVTGDRIAGLEFELHGEEVFGASPLLEGGFSENLVARRGGHDRWTLYHASGASLGLDQPSNRETRHLVQLDYILASPKLAADNVGAVPDIIRAGQPYRTPFPPGQDIERYPRTGWDRPKASDHCPVAVTLELV